MRRLFADVFGAETLVHLPLRLQMLRNAETTNWRQPAWTPFALEAPRRGA